MLVTMKGLARVVLCPFNPLVSRTKAFAATFLPEHVTREVYLSQRDIILYQFKVNLFVVSQQIDL